MPIVANPFYHVSSGWRDGVLVPRYSPDLVYLGTEWAAVAKDPSFPLVYKAEVNFSYNLADTGSSGPGTLVRQAIPGQMAAGMAYDTVVDSARLHFAVGMDVSMRMESWCPIVRASATVYGLDGIGQPQSQASRSITYEHDISGLFSTGVPLLGCASLGELSSNLATLAVVGRMPYCGDLAGARLSSGLRQPSFPYREMGCFKFWWPESTETLVSVRNWKGADIVPPPAPGSGAAYKAADFIPGWIPGYSLKNMSVTFVPQEFKFYTDFTVSVNSEGLYPVHSGYVTLTGSDLTEGFK